MGILLWFSPSEDTENSGVIVNITLEQDPRLLMSYGGGGRIIARNSESTVGRKEGRKERKENRERE